MLFNHHSPPRTVYQNDQKTKEVKIKLAQFLLDTHFNTRFLSASSHEKQPVAIIKVNSTKCHPQKNHRQTTKSAGSSGENWANLECFLIS